eukprot:815404-Karenia_brevis.AAC.1
MYGMRGAAAAWEKRYAEKLSSEGFMRGVSCGVVFYHKERDISLVVHGDGFTFCGLEEDLMWVRGLMESWFEIKVRAVLGPELKDDKEVSILGRMVRWREGGLSMRLAPNTERSFWSIFGFNSSTKPCMMNGDREDKVEEWEEEFLGKADAKEFRGLAARLNFMSLA